LLVIIYYGNRFSSILLYGLIPVIPFGWQIYVKAGKIWIIDYSHQLGFCFIILRKSGHKYLVL